VGCVLAAARAAVAVLAAAAPAEPAGRLVLDESSYNRAYVQFAVDRIDPGLLKREGEKVLDPGSLRALKREVRSVLKYMGREWDEAAWMDNAYVLYRQGQAWSPGKYGRMSALASRPPPPADWAGPDFDDAGWPKLRSSLMVGHPPPAARDDVDALGRRAGFFRYRFTVPDPSRAGKLTLRLVYHGGVRVLVNGTEVGRGHLPDGPVGPETRAEPYPLAAYVRLDEAGRMVRQNRGRQKNIPVLLDDVYGCYEDAPVARGYGVPRSMAATHRSGRHGQPGSYFTRKDWETVQKLRDRILGPLTIPADLLRKGTNVLAVEVRTADLHPVTGGYGWRTVFVSPWYSVSWFHAQLLEMELRCRGGDVPSMQRRPEGLQVWAEDVHRRLFSTEYSDAGDATGTLRFVAAANGSFAAQLGVGSRDGLKGLRVAPGALTRVDGEGTIPAEALHAACMVPHPVADMGFLSRGGRDPGREFKPHVVKTYLRRYGRPGLDVEALKPEEVRRAGRRLQFYDHISGRAGADVEADTCRPVWLTLNVPADAAPGVYRGRVRVQAKDVEPVSVPVEAEVLGWRVPDTPDWQVVLQIEQSPYAVAERYGVPLWSEAHFRLMEASFQHLGRIGCDWLFIPVLWNTELGNLRDSPLQWVRKADGEMTFDYRVMDRYIDLAVKHLGRPRVICFLVMHGGASELIRVGLLEEKTGRVVPHDVSPDSPTYADHWRTFGRSLYAHMRSRGLARSMYWGYMWDGEGDPNLSRVLRAVAPDVWWASGGHGHGYRPIYKANSKIYNVPYGIHSKKGWKRPDVHLLNPRGGGTVLACGGTSAPATFRLVVDRALVAGCNGIARIAADYWDNVYFCGCKAWHYLIPGMAVASYVLWPGPGGAESSQRFEVLREGAQEGEARIFLEQALDRGNLPPALAENVRDVLFRHNRENFFIPVSASSRFVSYFSGWQARSRRLFGAAAEVAAVEGLDVYPPRVKATVPARGRKRILLKLRNWTAAPRAWRIESGTEWLRPEKSSGRTAGHDELSVTLDAARLGADEGAKATLTVVDVAAGRHFPVQVAAKVGSVFNFTPPDTDTARQWWQFDFLPHRGMIPFNAPPGGRERKEIVVLNRSAARIRWRASTSEPWVTVAPPSGAAEPRSPVVLSVTASPPKGALGRHDVVLTLAEDGGPARIELPLAVHGVPPYRRPARPPGRAVPIDPAMYTDLLKAYRGATGNKCGVYPIDAKLRKAFGRLDKTGFERTLRGCAPYEAVFNIAGKGFSGFSAEVGFPARWTGVVGLSLSPGPDGDRLNYEIYVDGQLRAQSGFMAPTDDYRLLAVDGLAGAKELRLVVRPLALPGGCTHVHFFDPTFHRR